MPSVGVRPQSVGIRPKETLATDRLTELCSEVPKIFCIFAHSFQQAVALNKAVAHSFQRNTGMKDYIEVKGARVNNLKNVSVRIPHNRLVVLTGVSGSGKSSLAFDTLYAEGQRRYVESLSSYARQFLGRMAKPEVDFIEGLPPAIAIEQRVWPAIRDPRWAHRRRSTNICACSTPLLAARIRP